MLFFSNCGAKKCLRFEQQQIGRNHGQFRFGGPGKLEKIIHDPFQAQNFPLHHFHVVAFRRAGLEIFSAG